MSHREFMIVLAHTHVCTTCRSRLLGDPGAAVASRPLTPDEKQVLGSLRFEDFITPASLTQAAGITLAELDAYRDEAVVRLRHL